MPDPSSIRLLIKTNRRYEAEGVTCLVDISKGLSNVVEQVSSQIGTGITRLCHVIYGDRGQTATYSAIKDVLFLRDLDIIYAVKQDDGEAAEGVAAVDDNPAGMASPAATRAIPSPEINGISRKDEPAKGGVSKNKARHRNKNKSGPKHRVGTRVLKYFDDHGWYDGEIVEIDEYHERYRILYSDGDMESYLWGDKDMDKIVWQATPTCRPSSPTSVAPSPNGSNVSDSSKKRKRKKPLVSTEYHVGTKVRKDFGDYGVCEGTIVSINVNEKTYHVLYSDGDEQDFTFHDPELRNIVMSAKQRKTSNSSNEKAKTLDPPKKGRKARTIKKVGPLLTPEQRLRLRGHKIDIDDFEMFLVNVQNRAKPYVQKVLKSVKPLVLGEGISCLHWAKPFHCEPVDDFSDDINGLYDGAATHVDIYGDDNSKGWVWKVPLRRLEEYQEYYYNMNVSSEVQSDTRVPPEKPNAALEAILPTGEPVAVEVLPPRQTEEGALI